MIYLQREGKENFLSLVSEGGISLLSPSLLLWGLQATPTVGLRSLGSKVDNDQKWGTQPSPNFTSSEILNITAHSPRVCCQDKTSLIGLKYFPVEVLRLWQTE